MEDKSGKLPEANSPPGRDLTRTTLGVLLIGILIVGNFWILRPFLPSLLWAVMIVVATWPLMLGLQARLWCKRGLAVAVMTLALLLVFVVPFSLAVATIVENADQIADWAKSLKELALAAPPDWVGRIPLAGPKISAAWQEIASSGPEGWAARLTPFAGKLVQWFAAQAGSVGMMAVQFLLTVMISAILYSNGETAAEGVRRFVRRLAGPRGEDALTLAGKAVRGVALGIIVTALVQSILGGIGLAVAGVPAAGILTAVMFILCVAQVGAGVVLIPAVIWLYWGGHNIWGTVLLVVSILVLSLDNFLRPMLIKKGADLPLVLILTGVIGGLIAFGIIGIFIGPVVLAVTYRLLGAWVEGEMDEAGMEIGSKG
ncbi:MAG TPA: AI-2E family transporter YdiK [Thermodesulfobacteriota bacterium]|nr:AI-2E family transporter YdiK [Thermodesulfobacteriota bacterium]